MVDVYELIFEIDARHAVRNDLSRSLPPFGRDVAHSSAASVLVVVVVVVVGLSELRLDLIEPAHAEQ